MSAKKKHNKAASGGSPGMDCSGLVDLLQHACSIYAVETSLDADRCPYLLINFQRPNIKAMRRLETHLKKISGVGAGYADRTAPVKALPNAMGDAPGANETKLK